MIFDNIANYKNYYQLTTIYKALKFLSEITLNTTPTEQVIIEAENIFVNPVSLTSKPVGDCVFEAHRKYIDIHYILTGIEGISTRNTSDLLPINEFSKDKDIGFYSGKESGTYYLKAGDFMVCWPEDAHRVAMMADQPEAITKLVVKIKI